MTSRRAVPATRPRVLVWWAIGLTAFFVLMGVAVAVNPSAPFTQSLDDTWRRAVGASEGDGSYTWFLPMFLQHLGEAAGFIAIALVLPLALVICGRWRSAVFVVAAQLVGPGLYSQVMKNLVDRPRPAAGGGLDGPLFRVDHGSFPSGHAISAGVLVVIVAALVSGASITVRRAWALVGALLLIGMIWQRTLINAHWFSDAVTGALAGVGVGLLMWWAFWPWLREDARRPLPWRFRSHVDPGTLTSSASKGSS